MPLGAVATFTEDRAPTKIQHVDRQRVIAVSGDLDRSKTTLGEIIGKVNKQLSVPGFLPPGVQLAEQGDSQLFVEFLGSMAFALLTSIALIYMLMVILYGSFLTPFVIMFSIPVALIGALLALAITHQSINLFSAIGIIMLFGLVAKNGILLVDYANTLRKRGLTYPRGDDHRGRHALAPDRDDDRRDGVRHAAARHGPHRGRRDPHVDGHRADRRPAQLAVPHAVPRAGDVRDRQRRDRRWFDDLRARRAERRGEGEEPLAPPRIPAGAMGD